VFNADLEDPYNDCLQQHIDQGFSWRPGSASFYTLVDAGNLPVEIRLADQVNLRPDAQRAILVPFTVSPIERIGVSDLVRDEFVDLAKGDYALVFETGLEDEGAEWPTEWCRLTFIRDNAVEGRILRADASMSPSYPLLMDARPA
jgi:Competence protein J (ComJ)